MTHSTALFAGASGLVGGALLELVLSDPRFEQVTSLGRKKLDREHPKLAQHIVDFASLDPMGLRECSHAFCTLGTTLKRAGSQRGFRAVDHDAVIAFAKLAKTLKVQHFSMVSALGASARSLSFYNRVKGETEADLSALEFPSLAILQPSLLLGERSESRPGESFAIGVSRALAPLLKPFGARPIEHETVARAMLALALDPPVGTRVYPSGELHALASKLC